MADNQMELAEQNALICTANNFKRVVYMCGAK